VPRTLAASMSSNFGNNLRDAVNPASQGMQVTGEAVNRQSSM